MFIETPYLCVILHEPMIKVGSMALPLINTKQIFFFVNREHESY